MGRDAERIVSPRKLTMTKLKPTLLISMPSCKNRVAETVSLSAGLPPAETFFSASIKPRAINSPVIAETLPQLNPVASARSFLEALSIVQSAWKIFKVLCFLSSKFVCIFSPYLHIV